MEEPAGAGGFCPDANALSSRAAIPKCSVLVFIAREIIGQTAGRHHCSLDELLVVALTVTGGIVLPANRRLKAGKSF